MERVLVIDLFPCGGAIRIRFAILFTVRLDVYLSTLRRKCRAEPSKRVKLPMFPVFELRSAGQGCFLCCRLHDDRQIRGMLRPTWLVRGSHGEDQDVRWESNKSYISLDGFPVDSESMRFNFPGRRSLRRWLRNASRKCLSIFSWDFYSGSSVLVSYIFSTAAPPPVVACQAREIDRVRLIPISNKALCRHKDVTKVWRHCKVMLAEDRVHGTPSFPASLCRLSCKWSDLESLTPDNLVQLSAPNLYSYTILAFLL